jgi:hypothetical protein
MRTRSFRVRRVLSFVLAATVATWLTAGGELAAQCSGTTITAMSPPVVNQIWTACGSPYHITTSISVADLEIQEGVTVMCDPGVAITVTTWMRAIGTAQNPITFTAATTNGSWNGLKFSGGSINVNRVGGSSLIHCIIEKSSESGVTVSESNPLIASSVIRSNTNSSYDGAGLSVVISQSIVLNIETSAFEANVATHGNGGGCNIVIPGGLVVFSECLFSQNSCHNTSMVDSDNFGGAVRIDGNSVFDKCCFVDNSCYSSMHDYACSYDNVVSSGGAASLIDGIHSMSNCRILNNYCQSDNLGFIAQPGLCPFSYAGFELNARGCGVHFDGGASGTLQISNCLVSGNSSPSYTSTQGGGVCVLSGSATLSNCCLSRNSGDGLRLIGGSAVAVNSIMFYNNIYGQGPAQYGPQVTGSSIFVVNSCIQSNWLFGIGNIIADPSFLGSGTSLYDNTISSTSPCIDAGHSDVAYNDAQGCGMPPYGTLRNDIGLHGGPLGCSWTMVGTSTAAPTYPGSAEDLLLRTAVNGTLTSFPDVKPASVGQILQINLSTPSGTFASGIPLLVAQFLPQNQPAGSISTFPYVHFDPMQPIYILLDGLLGSPLGPMPIVPGGATLTYLIPPGFGGSSFIVQGLALNSGAANGIFAASNAHEIEFQ